VARRSMQGTLSFQSYRFPLHLILSSILDESHVGMKLSLRSLGQGAQRATWLAVPQLAVVQRAVGSSQSLTCNEPRVAARQTVHATLAQCEAAPLFRKLLLSECTDVLGEQQLVPEPIDTHGRPNGWVDVTFTCIHRCTLREHVQDTCQLDSSQFNKARGGLVMFHGFTTRPLVIPQAPAQIAPQAGGQSHSQLG
jgi:hypothetical protein